MTAELAKGTHVPEVYERPLAYEVTVWPEDIRDHPDGVSFCLTVAYRGHGRWVVLRGVGAEGMICLGVDGKFSTPHSPQLDGYDEWLAAHQFDRETALALAWEWAPKMRVVGITAADAQVQSGATVSFRSRSHSGKDRRHSDQVSPDRLMPPGAGSARPWRPGAGWRGDTTSGPGRRVAR